MPQFGTTYMKADGGKNPRSAHVKFNKKKDGGQKGRICTRESSHGGRKPRFAPAVLSLSGLGKRKHCINVILGETKHTADLTIGRTILIVQLFRQFPDLRLRQLFYGRYTIY